MRVRRRWYANFAPNLRDEIPKFPEIRADYPAGRARKNCASGQRALRILKEASLKMKESAVQYNLKKLAFGVEITQVLRQFCAKELQNF